MKDERSKISVIPGASRRAQIGVAESPQRTFIGGMRVSAPGFNLFGGWNVTYPLVRLSLFTQGLRLASTLPFPFAVLVPTWEARYDELSEISAVGNIGGFTTGVRFRAGHPGKWVIFWTINRPQVLDALIGLGLAVNVQPVRFRNLRPGR